MSLIVFIFDIPNFHETELRNEKRGDGQDCLMEWAHFDPELTREFHWKRLFN